MADQGVLFDERFLGKYAGAIISDTSVAIVELVANAWDAYATEVVIRWPQRGNATWFSITDNGRGMTAAQFARRWGTMDYDKIADEGNRVDPPEELVNYPQRQPYGRNGKGRHAAFRFSNPYVVRTWRDGIEVTYEVSRSSELPFAFKLLSTRNGVSGHGTEISATSQDGVSMAADEAREVIGTRFLADPNFSVSIDGTRITFDDVPTQRIREAYIDVPGFGTAHLIVIDTLKADKTTRQHGIAWRVQSRLVGTPGWVGFFHDRILDGRTTEAKRFQFLVSADFLAEAVHPDWSGFVGTDQAWQATHLAVHTKIREVLSEHSAEKRSEAKAAVRESLGKTVSQLPPIGRERWNQFVDRVVDTCPTISADVIQQVAGVLANLELSTSQYGLITKLHEMPPGDLDELHQILTDWTVRSAKIALDEIQTRLRLIEELDRKLRDETMDEVGDLQPLFERSLWVFGPEFESLDFTSNKGMTEVIRKLFGSNEAGSRLRPDFVMVPDGSLGFYSRDSHDPDHEVSGTARLVIAEIKKPGIVIGSEQKDQAWKYVKELIRRGHVTEATDVTCFVLGSMVDRTEAGDRKEWYDRVVIRPVSYSVFIKRAAARMLGLREKIKDTPFLREQGIDTAEFLESNEIFQEEFKLMTPNSPNKRDGVSA
ncbi:ATP-binding protein [Phreatobacter stygius]|uniref:ATP-binding protein n=1 Tax=Phreatobacter stygius TaxID=1940610 RepID=A0A4D7B0Q8_9HYPH|nr:ATP-binding protein [Phreatobacter stygius]QCI64583.1 ATP-binding protein [Phreatobacter stygius]